MTVMRDVTDLRRADQEVRDNLEKLRAAEEVVRQDRDRLNLVIENVGDPIVVADNSAKIVLLDPLAKELFGLANEYRDPQIVKNQAKLDAYLTAFTFSFVDKENKSVHLSSSRNAERNRVCGAIRQDLRCSRPSRLYGHGAAGLLDMEKAGAIATGTPDAGDGEVRSNGASGRHHRPRDQ